MSPCKICDNSIDNKTFTAREMLFGYRDEFLYMECAKCKCVQISEIPQNLSKYYPSNYYSIQPIPEVNASRMDLFIRDNRFRYWYGENNLIGMLLNKIYGAPFPEWLKNAKLKMDYAIMEIGSGGGGLLYALGNCGFKDPLGIDPYIEKDIYYSNGVRILKKDLCDINTEFDFIMLNHSFEHMDNPRYVVNKLFSILRNDKYLIIRIPISSSYAYRHYGANWVQLDPPRHLFLHSKESMNMLAEEAGFVIERIEYDSNKFQFYGSEQYIRNIPMNDDRSYSKDRRKSIFTWIDMLSFKRKAKHLNENKDGDQAIFYLYKP